MTVALLSGTKLLTSASFSCARDRKIDKPRQKLRIGNPEASHSFGYMLIEVNPGSYSTR